MNSTNPFRNQYTTGAPLPPSYDTSVSPHCSDEKSVAKSHEDKSPDPYDRNPLNQNPPTYREKQDPYPEGLPPTTSSSGYNRPDHAANGTANFWDTRSGPNLQMPQQQSSQNRGLLAWMGGNSSSEPPPTQFFRTPTPNHSYELFTPMTLIGAGHSLHDGWNVMPPPAPPGIQHPFITHDVREEDWERFLQDSNRISRNDNPFSGGGLLTRRVRPVGMIRSLVLQKRMTRENIEPLGDIIDAWNNQFFHPRRMTIVLARGRKRFSGFIDDYPPDIGGHRELDERGDMHRHRSSSPISSSDSDQSELEYEDHGHLEYHGHGYEGHAHRLGNSRSHSSIDSLAKGLSVLRDTRRSLRGERKARRRERRAEKREAKGGRRHGPGEKWRLVICFFDGRREVF